MITLLLFVAVIGVLVFVHELGHFLVAKKSGARVEEFGFGFPPRVFGLRFGETIYSLNLIPLGGFVKIYGEGGEDRTNPRSFASKSVGLRSLVVAAGVVMNFLFAVFLYSAAYATSGLPQSTTGETGGSVREASVFVVNVEEGFPAEEAGIKAGDKILGFENAADVSDFVASSGGEALELKLERAGEIIEKEITPKIQDSRPLIGISMVESGIVSFPWQESLWRGAERAFREITGIVQIFAALIARGDGAALAQGVTGPVGIAKLTQEVARIGWAYLLAFVGLISINLALLNILPFPALDGGRMLFLIIEKIKGSPVNKRLEGIIHAAGFAILIGLVILITVRDIQRFF